MIDADEESDPSLPSSDDGPVEIDEENVSLPDVDSCCKAACLQVLGESAAAERGWRELKMCLTATAQDKLEAAKVKYDCLRHWQAQNFGWRRFCAWGIPLCGKAACQVLSLSHRMYTTWCKHLSEGHREPPADQRKTQKSLLEKNVQAVCNANLLLTWLYEHVAEQLAESSEFKGKKFDIASPAQPSDPFLFTEVRWLAPGTSLVDMFDLSSSFVALDPKPSYSTFCRVYHRSWQGILKARSEGQHSNLDLLFSKCVCLFFYRACVAICLPFFLDLPLEFLRKCADCCRLKEFRKLATSPEDISNIDQAYKQHLESMFADRLTDAQWCQSAVQSVKMETSLNQQLACAFTMIVLSFFLSVLVMD